MITFTIVTCTYNASRYIERTLFSVLGQTYPNIEHLIIDGVSKDDTAAKARGYAYEANYPVIVKCEPDKGLYDAMNKGIQYAKGDYVLFLNAGDTFASPDTLKNIAACVDSALKPAVLYGDTDIVGENGEFLRRRRLAPPPALSWRSFKHGMLVCHQSFYARTDIAKRCPYNLKYRLSGDVDWCIRVMKEAEKMKLPIYNTKQVLCKYLDGGLSIKSHKASLKERFAVMREHYGLLTTVAMHLWFVLRAITS